MKKILFAILALMMLLPVAADAQKKRLHTIGDSTMQTYSESDTKRGWGQMLQQFFDASKITVNNRGKSGASSKSFYKEAAYWPTLAKGGSNQMSAGDILVIQFAHNDEKSSGTDGDEENALGGTQVDYRGTTPFGTFKEYLRAYINEAKAMGVKPILCGPICRKYFTGNTIRRNGRHDLGDNFNKIVDGKVTTGNKIATDDHTMDYVWQMQQVAMEYDDVPFIDLTTATADMYISYGDAYCTSNIFCPDDSTHPGPMGATLIARLFAQLVQNQALGGETDPKRRAVLEELNADIVLSSEISFSPTTGDMGKAYTGQSLTREFNVSAFGMTPAEGKVTFTVEGEGYTISIDKQNYGKSAEVSYTGSTLITQVNVKVTGTGSGKMTGKLTASSGNTSSSIDLSTEVVSLSDGQEVSVVWPLSTNADAVVDGPVTALPEVWADMEVSNYNTINSAAIWPEESGYDFNRKTQRNVIKGGSWPAGDIDEVSTRYIQFGVQANAETTLNVDKISMYVAGAGGSGMRCKVYYSLNSDFSDPQQIYANTSMAGNTVYKVEAEPVLELGEGERLYVRVYPWYNGAATGKTICLADVTVHGVATAAAGGAAESTDFSIAMGRKLDEATKTFTSETEELLTAAPEHVTATVENGKLVLNTKNTNLFHGDATNAYTTSSFPFRNICSGHGNASVKAIESDFYWGLKLSIEDGYQLNVNKLMGDMLAEKNTTGFQMAVYTSSAADATPVYAGETKVIANIQQGGSENVAQTIDVSDVEALKELSGDVYFRFHWYINSGSAAAVLKNFSIDATVTKPAGNVTKYELNKSVVPAEAGYITSDPELASYKEGSKVTLEAKKNFGYKFTGWKDAEGKTVSEDAKITVTMDSDKSLVANFEKVNVYTVSVLCQNDSDLPIGSAKITPNENEGKYEEGTEITVNAVESKILKFMQWTDGFENAGTSAVRKLTVNSDMQLVAKFEVQDFIAVFDASRVQGYASSVSYPFEADLTWDAERNATSRIVRLSDGQALKGTAGTPVVRNREGVVLSTIKGLYQNGYNTAEIAWQYQFSTKKFKNARIEASMAAKNAATKNWKAQYSLDGTAYTDLMTWEATANVEKPLEIALPADVAGKDMVYVRFMGVGTELLSDKFQFDAGVSEGLNFATNSESGFGNLYVFGEAEVEADDNAPVVTGTIPANGAEGISASGNITISFDERIEQGNTKAQAKLGDQVLTPTWSARSVSFMYAGLEYGETYTFTMPAGYVQDKSGNQSEAVSLKFTVMNRQQPQARTFDAIVDHSLELGHGEKIEATASMPAQYRYIQDAIDDAPSQNEKPYLIYIKEGYYDDPNLTFNQSYGTRYKVMDKNSQDKETEQILGGKNEYDDCKLIFINKPNIHIIGQAADKVTIATDRLDGGIHSDKNPALSDHSRVWYHVNAGATVEVYENGKDFFMQGVTLDNENWTIKKMEGPQALSLNIMADRAVFDEVNARSYQDTYKTNGTYNRQFWNNSIIEGGVDFIYGSGDVWFENCQLNINRKEGGFIVAPNHPAETRWGYVFNNTRITSTYWEPTNMKVYLGRPWHENPKTVFLHTQCEVGTYDGYWYPTMGGIPALWAVYDIWDMSGNKKSETSIEDYYYTDNDGKKVEGKAKNYLTDEEVAQYTLSNVMAGDGTIDADKGLWNPMTVVEKTATPVLTQSAGTVLWEAAPYAICYVVTVNGKPVAFPTECYYDAQKGDKVSVQSVNEFGALSAMSDVITVTTETGISDLDTTIESQPAFNLAGQKVNATHRGIMIRRGVKAVVK